MARWSSQLNILTPHQPFWWWPPVDVWKLGSGSASAWQTFILRVGIPPGRLKPSWWVCSHFSSQMRKATDLSEALKSNVSFWPRRVGKQTRSLRFSNLFFLIFSVRRRLLQRTCQLCHMSHQTPRKDSKKDWPWRRWRHARNAPAVNSNAGFVVTSRMSLWSNPADVADPWVVSMPVVLRSGYEATGERPGMMLLHVVLYATSPTKALARSVHTWNILKHGTFKALSTPLFLVSSK